MHSLNFGIGGNRTEHVLWRLQNGELEVLSPKVIVLQVGTHNHGDSADEVAEGIKAICNLVRDKQPQAFLVVLTLLPRGQSPNPLRERNSKVNELVAEQLKGNSRAQLVNIGKIKSIHHESILKKRAFFAISIKAKEMLDTVYCEDYGMYPYHNVKITEIYSHFLAKIS